MSEQKWKGGRVKRKHIQAGDGWTVVTHSAASRRSGEDGARDARPTRIVEGLTVEKLLDDLRKMEARWRETTCAQQLERVLQKRTWDVNEAVCIGIGSFSLDWEHRHRSMWQLALFLATVKLVQHEQSQIRLYAQEPAFTPLDISFLRALNIAVLSADIQTHITKSSFVFAPFVDWYILLPLFLKGKDPELYIGNEVLDDYGVFAKTSEKERVLEESNETGNIFQRGREWRRVPEFEPHGQALEGLMVYWKEDDEGG
ncbi:hypothetical protein BU26DRAFT_561828 [Trematosphaeria pertusa]|uniref:SRR1-like domain-containing protein n=1 Tax=Trematosphaeria pertusa TaxID=390896 RepID=A0A6A6INL1_9PLEO|nr:uncharacterized protein BU26DRAFT_561828 [Trematosphaeria pertusa]KAF2252051.1 hypothetical protein BU26DRAFT_561828 [Trematosphaeria pertusa]